MWQKIDTFDLPEFDPKHSWKYSREVLLFESPNLYLGRYSFTLKGKGRWKCAEGYIIKPTHWMELPKKPEDA